LVIGDKEKACNIYYRKTGEIMKGSFVDVIVPVYNTEKYLPKCIESILAQTYKNIELILVDDGSLDDSGRICDEYAAQDSRIQVIHKENGGVSKARNSGIDKAKGEWLLFVDSDDWVEEKYVETFLKQAKKDVFLMQGLVQVGTEGEYVNNIWFKQEIIDTNKMRYAFEELKIFHYGYAVAKFYNRDIIIKYNIRFNENISYAEDLLFMLSYILHVEEIILLSGSNYNYRTSSSSLSQQYNSYFEEFLLFEEYLNLMKKVADKFSFELMNNILNEAGLYLMRSIYAVYTHNEMPFTQRYSLLKDIKKQYNNFILEHYHPNIRVLRLGKILFFHNLFIFDCFCRIKFRIKDDAKCVAL
jgi:glycosyltransferase involved in cell wall biosynthesis